MAQDSDDHSAVATRGICWRVAALALIPLVAILSGCGLSNVGLAGTPAGTSSAGTSHSAASAVATHSANRDRKSARGRKHTSLLIRTRVAASVGTLLYVPETLDNCGPESISSVLAYWHVYRTQAQVSAVLRADNSDFGMAPFDIPAYINSLGLRVVLGPRGNQRMIRAFISNGIPVIANQWIASDDQLLHYRPIESYDERTKTYVSADPYLGPGHVISFSEFRSIWRVRDRRFIVIFPPAKQALVNAILKKSGWSYKRAWGKDLAWFEPQLSSADINTPGTWLNYNGYVESAWTADQAGEYRVAGRYLKDARNAGENALLIRWIRQNMSQRIKQGIR
jgi:hypothetical protein